MRAPLVIAVVVGALLRAQSGCGFCTVNNALPPRTFDPPFLTINAGEDAEVVIQFALPETIQRAGTALYPNFAIFVDSLRLDGGNTYVSLKGNPSVAPTYNSSNPAAGALRFDQNHRYKQVNDNPPTYANVVVYQNPEGGSPSNPTPPRGCVRACIRGVSPTPPGGADTLRIYLRGFVDPNSISIGFSGITGNDIPNKDTTNLMPRRTIPAFGTIDLWGDVWTSYPVRVMPGTTTSLFHPALLGLSVIPNPAWGSATLRYVLARPAELKLQVFTLSGQIVISENLGVRPAGESRHSITLPAGLYVVHLEAEGHILRKQLAIVH
ncbi:MAG: T9SS type A sorting domain-containing protein [Bacteroidia bacterium]|nr:T9SS type A sorting domain-containing protein [Bacteroidia bacterium]